MRSVRTLVLSDKFELRSHKGGESSPIYPYYHGAIEIVYMIGCGRIIDLYFEIGIAALLQFKRYTAQLLKFVLDLALDRARALVHGSGSICHLGRARIEQKNFDPATYRCGFFDQVHDSLESKPRPGLEDSDLWGDVESLWAFRITFRKFCSSRSMVNSSWIVSRPAARNRSSFSRSSLSTSLRPVCASLTKSRLNRYSYAEPSNAEIIPAKPKSLNT